ncbi:MAG TPA: type II toxin-antitoxin system VapC family toxin [Candidatus Acidoferrum sp.]|nr:type II toxin-antitoxin system VapC family toxin [Candidatus Acidoferrum sp.]
MIILDTNVLSALMHQPVADQFVVDWLDKQPRTSVWTTSVTVLEIRYGLEILATGRKRSLLTAAFESVVAQAIDGRIAPFDAEAAEYAGDLMAARHKRGKPGDLRDTMIAGIVLARHATLVTRNTSHFEDLTVQVVNPWSD